MVQLLEAGYGILCANSGHQRGHSLDIGSGISAKFWFDNWTSSGPLIDLVGERGPAVSGLPINASVIDGISNGDWWLCRFRSRNMIIMALKNALPPAGSIFTSEPDDSYLWKVGNNTPSSSFSASKTWDHLYNNTPQVPWYTVAWFNDSVSKHVFLAWIVIRDRQPSRDRMRGWGLNVPVECILCGAESETRQHLFFDCSYSAQIWSFVSSKAYLTPPASFEHCVR